MDGGGRGLWEEIRDTEAIVGGSAREGEMDLNRGISGWRIGICGYTGRAEGEVSVKGREDTARFQDIRVANLYL